MLELADSVLADRTGCTPLSFCNRLHACTWGALLTSVHLTTGCAHRPDFGSSARRQSSRARERGSIK